MACNFNSGDLWPVCSDPSIDVLIPGCTMVFLVGVEVGPCASEIQVSAFHGPCVGPVAVATIAEIGLSQVGQSTSLFERQQPLLSLPGFFSPDVQILTELFGVKQANKARLQQSAPSHGHGSHANLASSQSPRTQSCSGVPFPGALIFHSHVQNLHNSHVSRRFGVYGLRHLKRLTVRLQLRCLKPIRFLPEMDLSWVKVTVPVQCPDTSAPKKGTPLGLKRAPVEQPVFSNPKTQQICWKPQFLEDLWATYPKCTRLGQFTIWAFHSIHGTFWNAHLPWPVGQKFYQATGAAPGHPLPCGETSQTATSVRMGSVSLVESQRNKAKRSQTDHFLWWLYWCFCWWLFSQTSRYT